MNRTSYLSALAQSFYSRELYREIARNGRGAGLWFQFLLIALATIVVTIRMHVGIQKWANDEAPPVVAQVPRIDIEHGIVRVAAPTPYTIRDPRTGKALAILDTSGQVTSLEGTEARVLLTRAQLILLRRPGFTQAYDLSKVAHFVIVKTEVARWVRVIAAWFALACLPFVLAGLYVGRLVVLACVAGILFVFTRSRGLDFAGSMRLGSIALAPATLVEAVLDLFVSKPPLWGFVWTLITGAYLVIAARSVAAPICEESGAEE